MKECEGNKPLPPKGGERNDQIMSRKEPKTNDEYKAHADAHCLAEAKAIMADEKRLKAASEAAKALAEEMEAKAKGMRETASGKLADKMYPKMETEKKE